MPRILVADDNVEWLSSLEELFSSEGFEVDAVKNGIEALDAAKKNPPDVIFTDLLMPEMDGFTLCNKLKARPETKDVPVIFCSGYFHEKDQKKLEQALGVAHFIRKPVEFDTIIKLVEKVLSDGKALHVEPAVAAEAHPDLQGIYNTTMLDKLTGMVDMLHKERQTYKDLLLRFNSLTDSASDAIIITNDSDEICYWNRAAEGYFQYSQDEVLKESLSIIIPDQMRLLDEKGLLGLLSSSEVTESGGFFEMVAHRKDGSFFPAELSHSTWQEGESTFHSIIIRDVTQRKGLENQLRKNLEGFIGAVAKFVEARDPYTAGHQRKVGELAVAIAQNLGLDEHTIEGIHFGGMIHDIGKISVPAEILSKPSRLTNAEYEIIKSHPSIGYDILKDIEFPWPVADIVNQHHERQDGSGYPQGLSGDEIALEAKIVSVADVVDAITSHRPYRPSLGLDEALEEIRKNRGTLYDPVVVDACLEVVPHFDFTRK
ncbi:PAS domain S-box-containing protein/HDIG domain-containing protein [Mariprofundus ferrinatatus]|uniref:PAS domain S-box-containing protein/HDIG domain-containing protein n=1 Tax=Mariprofundus ferrinatatus TaxID=1921087 RepID=A0A2K8L877_9PROT|nr:HD domain-containing phosphohydrolase [Mariprofundus ferrinatatus]ATX81134.1 PAS domain S-box-containing protein/HDIG domain-containing protein [Mariprofundus ferrinatatus]